MQPRAIAALITIAALALAPQAAAANRQLGATWSNPPGAPFALYNCRGEDIYAFNHKLGLGSYFSNESGKDIAELGVHFRLLRLDGTQIIGFTMVAPKRVTAGTKNNLEFQLKVPIDGLDHIECAPSYAKFSDGSEWKAAPFGDNPEPARSASPPPAASPSPQP